LPKSRLDEVKRAIQEGMRAYTVGDPEAQKHKTSKKELDNMRVLIARDLADAGIAGLSADRRFATAYNYED
jgi:N-acyl-D-aspartate/D-glutamate deacylase